MVRRPPRFLPLPALVAGLAQPAPARVVVVLALYVLISAVVFGGIAVHVVGQLVEARDARETELLRELERREMARHALEAALAEMRRRLDERNRQHAGLDRAFQQVDAERAALEDERNLARERARLLDRDAREIEGWLETAQRERLAMEHERAALEARLIEVDEARALAEGREQRLRWRLENTAAQLARLEADRDATTRWLGAWIGERLGAIETVLQRTGIEPGRLLARAPHPAATDSGLGGPLLPLVEPALGGAALELSPPFVHDLALDIDRLEAAERLLSAVPLAAPFDHYHQTSRFGPRTDPITRRRALHNGLDFGAAAGSKVLATAPGRVTRAGRMGSYGIMVEVDHGHGFTTRYAHLSRTLVEPGDRVSLRTPVGIIGNTGRSTGRHLHYEIHLDGRPVDPAHFIAAGHQLIGLIGT